MDEVGSAELVQELKRLVVDVAGLDVQPGAIGDDEPLAGDGLGLDSVALLSVVTEIEDRFDVAFDDEDLRPELFRSFTGLARRVAELRAA